MTKHKSLFVFFGLLLLGSVAIGSFFVFKHFGSGSSAISGTVFKVIDKPNTAEDGAYIISVQSAHGQEYIIDATGYRNIPSTPDKFNERCVDVPRLAIGDRVSFKLPPSTIHAKTYDICYPKTDTGYYFNKL